jgi:uncharacterized protein YmfQ (DUF2313 family)
VTQSFSGEFSFVSPALPREPFLVRMKRWDNRAFYVNSSVYENFMAIAGTELDDLHDSTYDVLDQFFVDTATWGLDRWESEMSIVPRPGASLQERREAIRARMRGLGTATIKLIKNVGEAYVGGAIDVIEDHEDYAITIQFVDLRGVPLNLPDVQAVLRALVPAHLTISFVFRYSTWDRVDAAALTWDAVDALALTWDAWDTYF